MQERIETRGVGGLPEQGITGEYRSEPLLPQHSALTPMSGGLRYNIVHVPVHEILVIKGDAIMGAGKNWGNLVRTVRSRLGLTQEQVASRLGVTFASVNRWENQRVTPSRLARRQIEGLLRSMASDGEDLLRDYFEQGS
jgi:DNA-binding XRE family transcriptional regulator